MLVFVLALPALYLAGYFFRSASNVTWPGNVRIRGYHHEWEAAAYLPVARLESLVTGHEVHTVGPGGSIR
jgi:hypothetical protein